VNAAVWKYYAAMFVFPVFNETTNSVNIFLSLAYDATLTLYV